MVDDIDGKKNDQPWPGLIALQQDDGQTKILVGGWTGSDPVTGDYVITRYTAAGDVDGTFAASGRLYVGFAGIDQTQMWGLTVTAANQIIAAGRVYLGGTAYSYDAFAARYSADGALDPSFGVAGLARSYLEGEDNGAEVVVQADGKIVIVCNFATGTFPPDEADLMVFRWNADGTPDSTFGPYGNGRSESASTGVGDLDRCIQLTSTGDILIGSRPFAVTKFQQ